MQELGKLLDSNEKLLWQGKPKFFPYFLGILILIIIGSLLTFALVYYIKITILNVLAFAIFIVLPLYKTAEWVFLYYAITDKRIFLQKGIIGRKFSIINKDSITNVQLQVSWYDKFFGNIGTILIHTPTSFIKSRSSVTPWPYQLNGIENPYEVFKMVKNE